MNRLAVYCGSSPGADPIHGETAAMVGRTLGERGIGVVYGGGRNGLMGKVADAALAAGGEVIGVIPEALVAAEVAHPGCTRLETVDTMHERKARMTELSDGFIVLPGGIGTMDELFEALSWAQLGYHAKPVGILEVGGFYAPLLAFLDGLVPAGFLREKHRRNLLVSECLDSLLGQFRCFTAAPPLAKVTRRDL
ncbi:MAG: TIGR00730 family Rossman fold protein [Sphingomonadaceae bacterium]|nr:TIGR00730 family Rossman fold protein [Sphingomonadaceae bacterium]